MQLQLILNGIIFFILSVAAVFAMLTKNWSNLFVIFIVLTLSLVPVYVHRKFNFKISPRLRMGVVLFLFATLFLGEVNHFYDTYKWWDALLHFCAGLGLTLFGFVILREIYSQSGLRSTPAMTSFFAFSFTGMMVAVWEVCEFVMDVLGWASGNMQPSNTDTMIDIILGLAAALIVCVLGYRYLRYNEKNVAAEIIEETRQE